MAATGTQIESDSGFPAPAVVVMSKAAQPGSVKTRLAASLGPQAAAQVHQAMRRCVLQRLAEHFQTLDVQLVLAVDHRREPGPSAGRAVNWASDARRRLGFRVLPQGEGDLGRRMLRIWRAVGGGAAAFFGTDSPDVPAGHLAAVSQALLNRRAALAATSDGGYWALVAGALEPRLMGGIDWGSDSVYHQTLSGARQSGLMMLRLPPWHDVDELADLAALRQRLATAREPALTRLRGDLARICKEP